MIGECAAEAKAMTAVAMNSRYDLVQILALHTALYSVFAVGRRTPLEVLFVIDVRSCEERVVSIHVSTYLQPIPACKSYRSWSSDETTRQSSLENCEQMRHAWVSAARSSDGIVIRGQTDC